MEISNKNLVLGSLIVVGVSVAIGRYTAPEKIKIEKEYVQLDSKTKETKQDKSTDLDKDRRIQKTVVEVQKPDGTKETTTTVTEDITTKKKTDTTTVDVTNENKITKNTESKEVESKSGKTHLNALVGSKIDNLGTNNGNPLLYGVHGSIDLLGPISVGAWGLTDSSLNNKACGLSLGISF